MALDVLAPHDVDDDDAEEGVGCGVDGRVCADGGVSAVEGGSEGGLGGYVRLLYFPFLPFRFPSFGCFFSSEIVSYLYMMLTVRFIRATVRFICLMTMVDIGYRMSGGICMLLAYLIYAVFILPRTGRPNVETRSLLDFQVCRRLQVSHPRPILPRSSLRLSLPFVVSPSMTPFTFRCPLHDFHSPLVLPSYRAEY